MEVSPDTCVRRRVKALLLTYLFVVQAAAECRPPQGSGNIVMTEEALHLNKFPDGSDVMLECANGYVTESGTGKITCTEGNWTEPNLLCKKMDCGPPKPQPNMSSNTSSGTLFGDVIRVVCDKGYQISGSSYKQCYATGWLGSAKCEIVSCDQPGEVTNGRSSWDSQDEPKYGEIIEYSCYDGYTLVGKDSIVCSETGEYDSRPPECKGVTTTEDRITSTMVTPPAQEESTFQGKSGTPRAQRDKAVTNSPTPTVPTSVQGGRDSLTAEDKATTTSVTSTTLFQDKLDAAIDNNKDIGYVPVIVSVICVTIAVCIIVLFIHKLLLKRKGSSATGTAPIY